MPIRMSDLLSAMRLAIFAMFSFASISNVDAQSIAGPGTVREFDVASIKLHPQPITASYDPMVRGSQVVGMACSLRDMITAAYSIRYDGKCPYTNW